MFTRYLHKCRVLAFALVLTNASLLAVDASAQTSTPRNVDSKAGAVSADAVGTRARSVSVSKLYAEDVEALNDLAYQGKRLFLTDMMRRQAKGCIEYCRVSVQKAVEGRLREAIRNGTKALHLAIEEKEEFLLAYSKRDLASAYNLAGKDDLALRLANEAIEHQRRARVDPQAILVPLYRVRGDVYLRRSEPRKALAEYEQANRLAFRNVKAFISESMLRAYLEAGELEKAKEIATDLMEENALGFQQAGILGMGDIALRQNKSADAIKYFGDSLKLKGAPSFLRIWAFEGIGRAHLATRDSGNAIRAYLQAVQAAEALRLRFTGQEFRAGVFGQMQRIFDESVRLLMEDSQIEPAWAVSERGRARGLLDLLRGGVTGSEASAVISDPLGKVRSLSEIQGSLAANEVMVQFHVLAEVTYAWLIRKDGISGTKISVRRQQLESKVNEFRRAMIGRKPAVEELGRELYDILIKPLALPSGHSIVIVTHDVLHHLPFQALHDGAAYLIDARAISYAPSASAFAEILQRSPARKERLFAVGNPQLEDPTYALPGAEREVKLIEGLFPTSKVLLRGQATKAAFIENAEGSDVLHIAAHSVVDSIDPMYSRILLAGADVATSELEAHEIYRLNLGNTRLVTLSSCETALGKVTSGDELWGFSRAFLGAGARALVASLWPVADESTEIMMEKFYRSLAQQDLRGALRTAQLALKSDSRYAHPYFWAPFNLVGDWR